MVKYQAVAYSIWNLILGLSILIWQGKSYAEGSPSARSEILFTFAIALFHFIYSIWFWKGREIFSFIKQSLAPRTFVLFFYILCSFLFYQSRNQLELSDDFKWFFLVYLLLHSGEEIANIVFIFFSKRKIDPPDWKSFLHTNFEYKNRFVFAIYMILMGIWILSASDGFLRFFRLPVTVFPGLHSSGFLFGPIHIIGLHFLLLSYYNLIAVFYQIEPLIEAGMRGGSFTCVFLLILVILGILSPMILLIPLVDLISVVLLFGKKLIRR
ncbi:hypothetical protein LPTSP3_g06440 [Leptospira kobayashii]|uniref:Lipoprotein n=1 Tax=Leptospira kobayashii TaxID=1917830 RepID=A0ABM7UGW7_9LEPT|nr:hypothetical protein [Leptospira kobayashii]BDA77714.1 hypothetical protein LPTSP3_g06440 [Leptospira kobayashii]